MPSISIEMDPNLAGFTTHFTTLVFIPTVALPGQVDNLRCNDDTACGA